MSNGGWGGQAEVEQPAILDNEMIGLVLEYVATPRQIAKVVEQADRDVYFLLSDDEYDHFEPVRSVLATCSERTAVAIVEAIDGDCRGYAPEADVILDAEGLRYFVQP